MTSRCVVPNGPSGWLQCCERATDGRLAWLVKGDDSQYWCGRSREVPGELKTGGLRIAIDSAQTEVHSGSMEDMTRLYQKYVGKTQAPTPRVSKDAKVRHLSTRSTNVRLADKKAKMAADDERWLNARNRTRIQRKYTITAEDGGQWTTNNRERAIAIFDKFDGATAIVVNETLFVGFELLDELGVSRNE